jgi:hypothetical protein
MMPTDLRPDQPARQPHNRQPNNLFLLALRQPLHTAPPRPIQLDRRFRCVDPLRPPLFWRIRAGATHRCANLTEQLAEWRNQRDNAAARLAEIVRDLAELPASEDGDRVDRIRRRLLLRRRDAAEMMLEAAGAGIRQTEQQIVRTELIARDGK